MGNAKSVLDDYSTFKVFVANADVTDNGTDVTDNGTDGTDNGTDGTM